MPDQKNLIVTGPQKALWGNQTFRCVIGRNGFASPEEKTEGDGKTPIGDWAMLKVYYRPDAFDSIETELPTTPIKEGDGWCDDPLHPSYNQLVDLSSYKGKSAENLWTGYDLFVVLGYNTGAPVPGKGSAIFLHIARPDFSPSAGCIHLTKDDLLTVLREAKIGSKVSVRPRSHDLG